MIEPLSLTQKHWVTDTIAQVPDLVDALLQKRALAGLKRAGVYKDTARAVERIRRAKTQGERIGIFGDYDCDGVTAAAQLVRYCRRHSIEHIVRLPHRVHDGYGLQEHQVHEFAASGIHLLLTVDTGIASTKEIALAQSLGIDVIVTDHHTPGKEIPNAYAILHPMLETDFPTPHPSGAGVVFALLQALENESWTGKEEDAALAAIGTVADLVPLQGANRTLVQQGLEALQQLHSCPLADLRDQTRSRTSQDIAFRIAPRINAAGRMEDPSIALSAVLDGGAALALLDELNERRQVDMRTMYASAEQSMEHTSSLLWSINSEYGHGIIGLIAGRLTEAHGKPSCVATEENGICTASLRSPHIYHITKGLQRCSHLLESFGGHAQAAGCSFAKENAGAFRQALEADIAQQVSADELVPRISIDAILQPQDVTLELLDNLHTLEPFGQGNSEPRFLLENITLTNVRVVGQEQNHVQCRIHGHKAIGFSLAHLEEHFQKNIDVVARLGIDTWSGTKQPQLLIEDMRLAVAKPVAAS